MIKNYSQVNTVDGRTLFVFMCPTNNGDCEVSFDVTDFRSGNLMINATNLAKMCPGKAIGHFLSNSATKEYIHALESDTRIPISLLIRVEKGNYADERQQGTWMHRNLALKFARWCNPYLSIWCHEVERFLIQEVVRSSGIDLNNTGYFGNDPRLVQVDGQDILVEQFVNSTNGISVSVPFNVTYFEDDCTMIYVTDLIKAFPGKKVNNFLRNGSTKEFINALKSVTRIPITELCRIEKGNYTDSRMQGTWMHWSLALEFAQWLDPHFGVWCNTKVLEVMEKGMSTVYPQELQKFHNIIGNLKTKVTSLETTISDNQPKVDYYDNVLNYSGKLYTSTEALVALNLNNTIPSAKALHQILIDNGYAYRVGNMLRIRQPFGKLDLQRMETVVLDNGGVPKVIKTYKWTEHGLNQLFAILGSLGYRPRPF